MQWVLHRAYLHHKVRKNQRGECMADKVVPQSILTESRTSTVCSNLVSKVQKAVHNILYFRKYWRDIMKPQNNSFHFKRWIDFVQDLQYLGKSSVSKLSLQKLTTLSLGGQAIDLVTVCCKWNKDSRVREQFYPFSLYGPIPLLLLWELLKLFFLENCPWTGSRKRWR